MALVHQLNKLQAELESSLLEASQYKQSCQQQGAQLCELQMSNGQLATSVQEKQTSQADLQRQRQALEAQNLELSKQNEKLNI